MDESLFSVIVPVYNSQDYIYQCLESIFAQTCTDFELLVIDDGSKDKSIDIVRSYNDKRLRIFQNSHKGPAHARNCGIKNATGKYILFVDADDWLAQNILEEFKKNLLKKNAEIILAPTVIYKDNKNSFDCKNPRYDLSIFKKNLNLNEAKTRIKINYEVCTKLYKKKFLLSENILFPSLSAAEDLPFYWNCITKAKNITKITEGNYFYRKYHKKSPLHNDCKQINSVINAFKISDKIIKNASTYEDYKYFYQENMYEVLIFWLYKLKKSKNWDILYDFGNQYLKESAFKKTLRPRYLYNFIVFEQLLK